MGTITQRGIDDLPIMEEFDRPDFGTDFGWVTADLFTRPYKGLMRTSWGDVVVYSNADLAALRAHPGSTHQPIDVMFESFGDVDKSGLNRLFGANTFSWQPPVHKPGKQLLMRLFTPKSVGRFHDTFVQIVRTLLDDAIAREQVDFVKDVARPAVAQFWSHVLGLTVEEATELVHLAGQVQASFTLRPSRDVIVRSNTSAHEYMDLLNASMSRAAAGGEYPLLTELVAEYATMDDLGRPADPFVHLGAALIDGFHTLGAILSSVVYALLEAGLQPEATDRPVMSFATAAYQEGVRLHSAITALSRWAVEDFVYDDVLIPRGTNIQMAWLLGNRDPEVFDDPATYRLDRANRVKQFSFGGGFYVCAGRSVVQALSEVLLAELAGNSIAVELAGEARWDPASLLHELKALPVALRRR
ncbi:cytochrome P450 [Mycobacterium sp. 155]|uniref:cytochrome P450 n=1 Tax=Mycobacterium sp. 155 TaxID=1157943 RepID=UPI000378A570|nr:cytochrome P450 [Mycobacterium sp. 155]